MAAAHTWDPFGQPVSPAPAGAYGWLARHQRHRSAGTHVTQMGAHPYHPGLGRFLAVDPVEGGGANDYAYPWDPVNVYDLDGHCWGGWGSRLCKKAARRVSEVRRFVGEGVRAVNRAIERYGDDLLMIGSVAFGLACTVASGGACAGVAFAVISVAFAVGSAAHSYVYACRRRLACGQLGMSVASSALGFGVGRAAGYYFGGRVDDKVMETAADRFFGSLSGFYVEAVQRGREAERGR